MNSGRSRERKRRRDSLATNVSTSGATITSPIPSPRNHTPHRDPNRSQGCIPVKHRLVTPIVELTIVLTIAPKKIRPKKSRNRSREGRNPITRLSRYAPTSASSVLPVAMPRDVTGPVFVVRFTINAPSVMAGQMRYPSKSTALNAIPVGGQTTVTCSATNASLNPIFALATYTAAVSKPRPMNWRRPVFMRGSGLSLRIRTRLKPATTRRRQRLGQPVVAGFSPRSFAHVSSTSLCSSIQPGC